MILKKIFLKDSGKSSEKLDITEDWRIVVVVFSLWLLARLAIFFVSGNDGNSKLLAFVFLVLFTFANVMLIYGVLGISGFVIKKVVGWIRRSRV